MKPKVGAGGVSILTVVGAVVGAVVFPTAKPGELSATECVGTTGPLCKERCDSECKDGSCCKWSYFYQKPED